MHFWTWQYYVVDVEHVYDVEISLELFSSNILNTFNTYHLTILPPLKLLPTYSTHSVTMESAANAVSALFKGNSSEADKKTNVTNTAGRDVDTTVDSEIAPSVEHTHVKKQHETRQHTHVEKEKHQDHYHTTIQPVKDSEVLAEKHDNVHEAKSREINRDDGTAAKAARADRSGFESTSEEKQFESKVVEPTTKEENVHHHLHETIQPVIEKGKSSPQT